MCNAFKAEIECPHFGCREKLQIEREKLQYEADVRLRQGEVTMLQKELDAITSTLTQLESQKKEAQKRLDELDDKVTIRIMAVLMIAYVK